MNEYDKKYMSKRIEFNSANETEAMMEKQRLGILAQNSDRISAIPKNEAINSVADFVKEVRAVANRVTIPDFVPLLGDMGVGDLFIGQAPEEIENIAYGNMPFEITPMGDRIPRLKRNRKESFADAALLGVDATAVGVPVAKAASAGVRKAGQVVDQNKELLRPVGSIQMSSDSSVDDISKNELKPTKTVVDADNLTRAREQGFDVDNPIYHGTNSDKLTEFDENMIGSATDEGFFGRGFYFASTPGEARYYGRNVGKYVVKGNLLDLTNNSGDYTLGGPRKFIEWAEKLDKIDMLDDATKAGLEGAKKLLKYFNENIEYKVGMNPDRTKGVYATIVDPTRKARVDNKGKKYPITIDSIVDARGFFPKNKQEAEEQLLSIFAYEMRKSAYKDIDFFEGWNDNFYDSLSDYIRVGGKGSAELTKQAKKAGYDGIRVGDETVIFDPKNIRSIDAEFDPNKSESPDLLSSAEPQTTKVG